MSRNSNADVEKVDFDKFANQYENILDEQLDFFGEENSYFAEYKIKLVKDTIGFEPVNILEFGCGIGRNLKFFLKYFPNANVYGSDISVKSLDIARRENSDIDMFLLNVDEINKCADKFDLIFTSCVFHHIKPSDRNNSIEAIHKMLRNNGAAYIFEHNPYNPVTRHIVNTCPWDTDAILLNMKETVDLMHHVGLEIKEKKYSLFFPAVLKSLRPIENYLGKIPLGGQYYVKGVKKA